MQEEIESLEKQSPHSRNHRTAVVIIFKQCKSCGINFEDVSDYYQFDDDDSCIFCSNGEPVPFENMEFVTVEDLDTYTPPRIQDCFSQIDKEIPKEIVKPSVQEPKHLKHKKKKPTKDKQQNENKDLV